MRRIVLILFASLTFAACSTRVVYERPPSASSPNAVNINTATADELERLPHIGRKTAEAIVEFRTENGPFLRLEHLMLIRGVSEKRFDELRPMLRTE
jgi:competence ComEA-like helix-hairpin-helix protein